MKHLITLIFLLSATKAFSKDTDSTKNNLVRFVCQKYGEVGKNFFDTVAILEQMSVQGVFRKTEEDGNSIKSIVQPVTVDGPMIIDADGLSILEAFDNSDLKMLTTGKVTFRMRIYNNTSLVSSEKTKDQIVDELLRQKASLDSRGQPMDFIAKGHSYKWSNSSQFYFLFSFFAYSHGDSIYRKFSIDLSERRELGYHAKFKAKIDFSEPLDRKENGVYYCEKPVFVSKPVMEDMEAPYEFETYKISDNNEVEWVEDVSEELVKKEDCLLLEYVREYNICVDRAVTNILGAYSIFPDKDYNGVDYPLRIFEQWLNDNENPGNRIIESVCSRPLERFSFPKQTVKDMAHYRMVTDQKSRDGRGEKYKFCKMGKNSKDVREAAESGSLSNGDVQVYQGVVARYCMGNQYEWIPEHINQKMMSYLLRALEIEYSCPVSPLDWSHVK